MAVAINPAMNGHSTSSETVPVEPILNPDMSEDENNLNGPLFNPPVYQQRYAAVRDLVRQLEPRKVVDMGCAECKLLRLLKFENCIEELIGVDMDTNAMYHNRRHLEPLTTDYIFRRPRPLRVRLMKGSIADADSVLAGTDLFSCIEVIEHLEEPTLTAVPQNVFGSLRPSVAIFSTPNCEFNVLFPNFTGFRHPDHKFEWTRQEFQVWCSRICDHYGYEVRYTGVGDPPRNRMNLGYCSQIAIFTKLSSDSSHDVEPTLIRFRNNYELIFECCYPYEMDTTTPTERLCREADYYVQVLSRNYINQHDPVSEGDDPVSEGDDPVSEGDDPVSEGDDPVSEGDDPVSEGDDPVSEGDDQGGSGETQEGEETGVEEYEDVGTERDSTTRDIGSEFDSEGVVFIRLDDLLRFHSIRRLTTDLEEIRHALVSHSDYGIRSHQGTHYVIVETEELESNESNEESESNTLEDRNTAEDSGSVLNGSQSENWDND